MGLQSVLVGYSVVFDAVYTPLETRLLKEAREVGSTIVSGLEMFIGQAAEQFELFTGRKGEGSSAMPAMPRLPFRQVKFAGVVLYSQLPRR